MTNIPENAFFAHIANASETLDIVARENILSEKGLILFHQNERISPENINILTEHTFDTPIEKLLTISICLSSHDIFTDASSLIETTSNLQQILQGLHDPTLPLNILVGINLPQPLAFRMTILKNQFPDVYEHCIRVALASIFFGDMLNLDRQSLRDLAAAGFLHDIAQLNISISLLNRHQQYTEVEENQYYVHPVIAYMLLKEYPDLHPNVSQIIRDHHEHIDGSGFPAGKEGRDIHPLGQILAVAEMVVGLCDENSEKNCSASLAPILRFNTARYMPQLLAVLVDLFNRQTDGKPIKISVDAKAIENLLKHLTQILLDWKKIYKEENNTGDTASKKMNEHLKLLEYNLEQIGLPLDDVSGFIKMLEPDSDSLPELCLLARESSFQLLSLLYIFRYRIYQQPDYLGKEQLTQWITNIEERLSDITCHIDTYSNTTNSKDNENN